MGGSDTARVELLLLPQRSSLGTVDRERPLPEHALADGHHVRPVGRVRKPFQSHRLGVEERRNSSLRGWLVCVACVVSTADSSPS